jgi:acyl-CoA synthetase (NDP forming)
MSGGAGVLMSDQCERAGLAVPELAPSTQEALRALLPAFGAYRNPVDLTAQFVMAPMEFRKILGEIAGDSGVDSIALFFNLIHQRWEPVVEAMHAVADEKQKPMAVAWVMPPEGAATRLHQVGIPMYPSSLRLVRALGHLAAYHQFRGSEVARDVLAMPPPAPTSEPVGAPRALAEHEAKRRLEAAGLPVTREILAGSVAEARAAAGAIGYPVVLKVQSAEIPHKTEVGGVRIGIRSDDALGAASAAIVESARRFRPGVPIDGVLVQEQVEGAIGELLVGVARDPVFGPVLLCGLGGTLTEVFHDVSRRLLPVNRSQARAMLGELRCLPLFEGARGRPRGDLNAVVEVLVAVSHWALAEGERLLELDINPLMVMPEGRGALVADALIVEGKGGIA